MQPPSAYHVLVRTANDTAVVEGQAIALSLRYEERPKRIPLLIRLLYPEKWLVASPSKEHSDQQ